MERNKSRCSISSVQNHCRISVFSFFGTWNRSCGNTIPLRGTAIAAATSALKTNVGRKKRTPNPPDTRPKTPRPQAHGRSALLHFLSFMQRAFFMRRESGERSREPSEIWHPSKSAYISFLPIAVHDFLIAGANVGCFEPFCGKRLDGI